MKLLQKHVFKTQFLHFLPDPLHKGRTKLESTWLIILSDYTNVITSFEMTMNSKHRTEKLKTKKQKDIETQEIKIKLTKNRKNR